MVFEIIDTEKEGYYIKRRASTGEPAKSLSEGERTAVALVYFLSKLEEKDFDLKNGIVVIDDPISSLDSNALFQAFGFIRAKIKEAKQVFILTHNFDFFKHVKNWFQGDDKNRKVKETEFFMVKNNLQENKNENDRTAKLCPLDNLLKKYDTEYQYLFSLLSQFTNSSSVSFKEVYPYPNMARRFMETFLPFKFPAEKNLYSLFSKAKDKVNFEHGKIEQIKRFLDAHSHADINKMNSWDVSQWSEGQSVIEDILELVEKLDKEHYDGLCKLSKKAS